MTADPTPPFDPQHSGGQSSLPAPARRLPGYRVLLHNDDINEVRFVVRTLIELVHLDTSRATQVTHTAENKGLALVLITHRERAELFRDQFAARGLRVTIEPDER